MSLRQSSAQEFDGFAHEFAQWEPSEKLNLFFDLVFDAFNNPQAVANLQTVTISENRELRSVDLEHFAKTVHREIISSDAATKRKSLQDPLLKLPSETITYVPELAALWRRLISAIIDCATVGIGSALLCYLGFIPASEKSDVFNAPVVALLPYVSQYLALTLALWLALTTFFIAAYGQTLGQQIFQIKVVNLSGHLIGFKQSFLRSCSQLTTLLTLGLGLLPTITKQRRAFHDYLAGTFVVRA